MLHKYLAAREDQKEFVLHPVGNIFLALASHETPRGVALLEYDHQAISLVGFIVAEDAQVSRVFCTLEFLSICFCIYAGRFRKFKGSAWLLLEALQYLSSVTRACLDVDELAKVFGSAGVKALHDKPQPSDRQISDIFRTAIEGSDRSGNHEAILVAKAILDFVEVGLFVYPNLVVGKVGHVYELPGGKRYQNDDRQQAQHRADKGPVQGLVIWQKEMEGPAVEVYKERLLLALVPPW